MTTTKKEVEEEWRTRMVQNVHFIRKGQARGENCKETSLSGFTLAQQQQQKRKKIKITAISKQWLKKLWRIRSTTNDGMKRVRHEIERSLSASLRLSLSFSPSRELARATPVVAQRPLSATQRSGHPCAQPEVYDRWPPVIPVRERVIAGENWVYRQ